MENTFLFPVVSSPTANFTEALAQNAVTAMNNLAGVPAIASRRFLIRAVSIVAKDNFGPDLYFFNSANGYTTAVATDGFVSRFGFTASMGEQLAATGLWRYYIDGLSIPYVDLDTVNSTTPPTLHVVMMNTEATAKVVGAAGAIVLTAWLQPMGNS